MHHQLSLQQQSMWNGFAYDFISPAGVTVGELRFPNFAQAKNARLRWHPEGSTAGDLQLQLHGQALLLRFEYTRRGFVNDLRYTLETQAHAVLCAADVVFEKGRRLPAIRLTTPLQATLQPSTSFWKRRFPVLNAEGNHLGTVYEPHLISSRFEYRIDLQGTSAPLQAFILALALLVRR